MKMFFDALSYPVRGSGWIVILVGAVFSAVLNLLQIAPGIGLAVGLFSSGYFSAFYLSIIDTTMTGRDDVPDWPGFSNLVDDIISPYLRLLVVALFAFLPMLAFLFVADDDAAWFGPGLICAIVYGSFYFPMAVLAGQAFGSVFAALPHVVLPAVFRALPGNLLAVFALALGLVASALVQALTSRVPYLGWFLTAAVILYSLMFQARLIGLVYRAKRDKLGWE